MKRAVRHWKTLGATVTAGLLVIAALGALSAQGQAPVKQITAHMVRSAAATAANCVPNAAADVKVVSSGPVETMTVKARGLPANQEFDFFVTQVPNAPFGMAWYQGDIETDANGNATQTFVGRFSVETFIVAPGSAPAPVVHNTDASTNPATAPIHTYHLGLWFGSPAAAAAAGCPNTVTPFNGDHHAGIQVLSTRNSADDHGPLRQLHP
jgi:hypothetical protein